MKSVLISIQPKWCEKICHQIGEENGKPVYEKRIEVRKSKPSEVPFKAYIYETKGATETPWADEDGHLIFKGRGQVIGEFICDNITTWEYQKHFGYYLEDPNDWTHYPYLMREKNATQLTCTELENYGKGKTLYGWHISDLKVYNKPKELSEFRKPCPDKYQYCQGCKYGFDTIPSDEEEYAMYHCGGYGSFDTICLYTVNRPPQSWYYVEELKGAEK